MTGGTRFLPALAAGLPSRCNPGRRFEALAAFTFTPALAWVLWDVCFPFSRPGIFEELKSSVAGLTEQEFEQWVKEGRFDSREIDGERRFMEASVSNLFCVPYRALRVLQPQDRTGVIGDVWHAFSLGARCAATAPAPDDQACIR
jgi:hypothetical protein